MRLITALAAGFAALAIALALQGATLKVPTLYAALETMMTLFAFAAAGLLRAQFTFSRRLRDLVLLCATLTAGLVELAAAALPAALNLKSGPNLAAIHLWGELFVGVMFAAAAFTPSPWVVSEREHPVATAAFAALAALVTVLLGGLALHAQRPGGMQTLPASLGQALIAALAVAAAGALTCAAIGFSRPQWSEADAVAGLLATAVMLMAGASFAHALQAPFGPGLVVPSEWLRVVSFGLILAAALTRERQVRHRISKATALAERRRVARDLHDGIAQDLAFIAAHGPRLAQDLGDEHPLVVAAKRALAISRSTITDLADESGATADEALEAVAQELRERFGIAIVVHAQLDRDLASATREQLTRITREAIANAARHGQAKNVVVWLGHTEGGISLRIVDDGCGIDTAAAEGFGLHSMRDRAAGVGGRLSVRQTSCGGTELKVVLT